MHAIKKAIGSLKKIVLSICTLLLLSGVAWAQNLTVTGKVTDKSGEGLPGVYVLISGTSSGGTTTGIDGRFSISAPSSGRLVFSLLGMETLTVDVNGRSVINVEMAESALFLEEVVVTALGITREKRALSYSIQEVSSDRIIENRNQNVVSSLAGKVAGLNISRTASAGGTTRILMRGISSLSGDNLPLIVVDGVPYFNRQGTTGDTSWGGTDYGDGLSNLNQDDVESISVLKGPTASALYGSRAGNGVILITTKKGSVGTGPRVSFSSNYTIDRLMIQPPYQNEYGQGSQGEYGPNDRNSWGPKMDGRILKRNNATWQGILDNDDAIMLDWTGQSRPFSYMNNDLFHLLQTGSTWNNSIEINAGSGKSGIRASVSDTRTKGVIPNNTYSRTAATLRANGNVTNRLTFDTKFSYTYQDGRNRPTHAVQGFNPLYGYQYVPRSINLDDFWPVVDPATGEARYFEAGQPTLVINPYVATEMRGNTDITTRLNGFAMLKYQFTDWLSMMGRVGVDTYNLFQEGWTAKGNRISGSNPGSYWHEENYFLETNNDFLITAQKDNIVSKLSGNISFGGNIMDRRTRGLYGSTSGGLNIDGIYTLSNSVSSPAPASHAKTRRQMQSLYAFAQLSWDNWLYFDVTARNDWSSTLPKENWSYFYPSVGLGWVVTDMLKSGGVQVPSWIDFGKIRASIAGAGNDTSPYSLYPTYSFVGSLPGGVSGVSLPGTRPNAELKPEITTSNELGLELRMFKNRLGFDFTYYTRATKNQIFSVSSSMTTGYSGKRINAGRIDNKGVELLVNVTPIRTRDLDWTLTVNYAKNKSNVVELEDKADEQGNPRRRLMWGVGATNVDVWAEVGRPIGELYTTTRLLDEKTGKPILQDAATAGINYGLPVVPTTKTHYVGNVSPDWTGGIYSSLQYKGFYFNFNLDIRWGGYIYLNSMLRMNGNGMTAETLEGRDTWYPFYENYVKQNRVIPFAYYSTSGSTGLSPQAYIDLYNASTAAKAGVHVEGIGQNSGQPMAGYVNPQRFFAQNVGYGQDHFFYEMNTIRLREISIGYKFPEKWLRNMPVHSLKLSAVANNVCFLYNNLPSFDPESTYTTGNLYGVETASIPPTRNIGFNLNITF
ncbi:MAG: SusC/RagA family TonB-linked outer membrane protein [Bacteroidales bacterium]|nr:SusC/RagA family TonB-linked outer membrane protein [Bacteroidales bacterium]